VAAITTADRKPIGIATTTPDCNAYTPAIGTAKSISVFLSIVCTDTSANGTTDKRTNCCAIVCTDTSANGTADNRTN